MVDPKDKSSEQLGVLLSTYLDGGLSPREVKLVEKAIQEDPKIHRRLEELRRVQAAVASLPRHAAPRTIADEVMAQLERGELLFPVEESPVYRGKAHRRPWRMLLSAAAVLTLVIGGGLWFVGDFGARFNRTVPLPMERQDAVAHNLNPSPTSASKLGESTGRNASALVDAAHKLAGGADLASLRDHRFDAEPVRLRVHVNSEKDREALANRVVSQLKKHSTVDLLRAEVGRSVSSEGFYYSGERAVNYDDATQRQILLHVPAKTLESVLNAIAQGPCEPDDVGLSAGPLAFAGLESTRDVLRRLNASPSASSSPSSASVSQDRKGEVASKITEGARSSPAADEVNATKSPGSQDEAVSLRAPWDELLRTLGISGSDGGSQGRPPVQEDKTAKSSDTPATPSALPPENRVALAEGTDQPVASDDRPPLVERRMKELKTKAQRGSAEPESGKETPSVSSVTDARSTTRETQVAARSTPPDSFVTLVIELSVEDRPGPTVSPPSESPPRSPTTRPKKDPDDRPTVK